MHNADFVKGATARIRRGLRRLLVCFFLSSSGALAVAAQSAAPETSLRPVLRASIPISARWDDRPQASSWTQAALAALRSHASALPQVEPRDIAEWCPAYLTAPIAQREAFWVGLLSTLAKHESTFRPQAVGGGGKWYGLMQILPATARGYRCRARTGADLQKGAPNLSCALRIMAVTVPRDGVVSQGMRGVAADWGPFHSQRKRDDMKAWLRKQSYCTTPGRSLRPQLRPAKTSD